MGHGRFQSHAEKIKYYGITKAQAAAPKKEKVEKKKKGKKAEKPAEEVKKE
jgi:hypothetical protein